MAFDPWTDPVGSHVGPWTFEQALTCMKSGGKVKRKAWPYSVCASAGEFWFVAFETLDPLPSRFHLNAEDILANDWMMAPSATEDGG